VSVKLLIIVIIVFKRYPSTYCLMQGSCFICSDFKHLISKLESQPLHSTKKLSHSLKYYMYTHGRITSVRNLGIGLVIIRMSTWNDN